MFSQTPGGRKTSPPGAPASATGGLTGARTSALDVLSYELREADDGSGMVAELLLALYRRGKLKLDELVTKTYPLAAVNDAFRDLESGANARGVVVF